MLFNYSHIYTIFFSSALFESFFFVEKIRLLSTLLLCYRCNEVILTSFSSVYFTVFFLVNKNHTYKLDMESTQTSHEIGIPLLTCIYIDIWRCAYVIFSYINRNFQLLVKQNQWKKNRTNVWVSRLQNFSKIPFEFCFSFMSGWNIEVFLRLRRRKFVEWDIRIDTYRFF